MKMMKKSSFKLALAILLSLLALTLVCTVFVIPSVAAGVEGTLTIAVSGEEDCKIKIVFDPDGPSRHEEELLSGETQTYTKPDGTRFNIVVEPKESGYVAVWSGGQPQLTGGTIRADTPLSYTVSFEPVNVAVNYVQKDKYDFTNGEVTNYVYGTQVPIINPVRSGYILKGWKIYDGDPEAGGRLLADLSDKVNIVLGENYKPDKNVWLEPVVEPICYPVLRLDVVYGEGGAFSIKEYLGYEILSIPQHDDVTGAEGPSTDYGGYLHYDAFDYATNANGVSKRNVNEISQAAIEGYLDNIDSLLQNPASSPNVVLRYYLPIEYPLDVQLNEGESTITYVGGKSMPTTHVFDQSTEIPTPIRPGFDFLYWEVSYLDATGQTVSERAHPDTPYSLLAKTCYGEIKLSAIWQVSAPTFKVDYVNEAFVVDGGIPAGRYEISADGVVMEVIVSADGILADGVAVDRFLIADAFFGKTVQIQIYGDGVTTLHNYVHLDLAARPKIPEYQKEIAGLSEDYTEIKVLMMENLSDGYVYEFAISKDGAANKKDLLWQLSPEFKELKPGTVYFVFVRVKASEGNYPHGVILREMKNTYYESYIEQKVNEVLALGQEGDGEMVNTLITTTVETLYAKQPSATFYDEVEALVAYAKARVAYARQQDSMLSNLSEKLAGMKASGAYSESSVLTLTAIYNAALQSIKTADQLPVAEEAYSEAVLEMNAVKITYLISGDLLLTSDNGLSKDTQMSVSRQEDADSVAEAVGDSVKLGEVVVSGTSMTQNTAIRELKSKNVIALYNMSLFFKDGTVLKNFDGTYTLRLLLPEDLRGVMGLQVAYYNESTGALEVLDTQRDGNYLTFVATSIDDFVIFGDPTVDLTILMIALGIILLIQILAIALLFVYRKKKGQISLRASVVLPAVALTIRIVPGSALLVVMILGALVILCQVFLTYLLLTSDLIRVRFSKKDATDPDAAAETMADVQVEDFEEGAYSSEDFADADSMVAKAYAAAGYTVGAEDDDTDGIEDEDEQLTLPEDSEGVFTFASDSDMENEEDTDSNADAFFIEDELAGGDSFEYDDEEDLARGAASYDEIVPLEDDEVVELDDFDESSND